MAAKKPIPTNRNNKPLTTKLSSLSKNRQITSAANDKDVKNLAEAAHSLKGAAKSAGAKDLGDIAEKLQTAAETNQDYKDLVEEISAQFKRVKEEVQAL